MAGTRRNEKPRQFVVDIYEGARRLVSNATVELWTRNHKHWRGQILFLAEGSMNAGGCYVLKTQRETRRVRALDIQILKGTCWVLFEQVESEPEEELTEEA